MGHRYTKSETHVTGPDMATESPERSLTLRENGVGTAKGEKDE